MTARNWVGVAVMLLATAVIAALFIVPIPKENDDIALVLLGVVIGWGSAVVQFHFGSSEGSKQKTGMLADRPKGTPVDPLHVEDDGHPLAKSPTARRLDR